MCEHPTFFAQSANVSRKRRICCECGRHIESGEVHELSKGVWAGSFQEFRTCAECFDIREDLQDDMTGVLYDEEVYCAMAFGNLRNELHEHCCAVG